VTLSHPIFTRWPRQYPDRLQLFSAPTPNGVKVGIMLEETSLAYEPHRIDRCGSQRPSPSRGPRAVRRGHRVAALIRLRSGRAGACPHRPCRRIC
jgi:hypothetical protein